VLEAFAVTDQAVSCHGGSDGSATASATGGTPPYTYLWNDPSGQSSATATGLSIGSYTVTVTDANGCTDIATITITEPLLVLSASAIELSPVNCFGGSDGQARASGSGGTPPYSYLWSDGQNTQVATG